MGQKVDQHVGRHVAVLRQQHGLSAEQVATALGVTPSEARSLEAGAARYTGEQIVKLSALLEVAPSAFFDGVAADQSKPDA